MSLIAASATVPAIASGFWMLAVAIVVNHPVSADLFCILGAGPGSICALLTARMRGASLADTVRVFLGSSAFGMFIPGALFQYARWKQWIPDTAEQYITWHPFALAGMLCSLMGWGAFLSLNAWLEKRAARLTAKWDRWFHTGDDADKPAGNPPTIKL